MTLTTGNGLIESDFASTNQFTTESASPPTTVERSHADPAAFEFEDESNFGLQGLTRETLQILKPGCMTRLAITLALRGKRSEIRDPAFVQKILSYHPDWIEEYQVIHLIEKSLWIQGRSDLVLTMTRNPSQIPDNPPPKVMEALARAYTEHPDATIWYGVPLFSDAKNSDGLPIPVTAAEVKTEAARRIKAAQQHALHWGWLYRSILELIKLPARAWGLVKGVGFWFKHCGERIATYFQRARADARRRNRALYQAELERCRSGYSTTTIPEHTTWLGQGIESGGLMLELLADRAHYLAIAAPMVGTAGVGAAISQMAPIVFTTAPLVLTDPFLFVELPDEPGKLRHIAHWYWQEQPKRRQKLHLHV